MFEYNFKDVLLVLHFIIGALVAIYVLYIDSKETKIVFKDNFQYQALIVVIILLGIISFLALIEEKLHGNNRN